MAHVESQDSGNKASQDFELNLAPIIDCMVVLIAFLMVSLSYLSIQMLDAGLSAPGGLSKASDSALSLDVKIETPDLLVVNVMDSNKRISSQKFERASWSTDLQGIVTQLGRTPDAATISAENSISYDVVVQTLDEIKSFIPNVQLSGF
jgi:biopolymer transport protein ExbD